MRLLKDRDLLIKKGSSWELAEGAEVPFPDSVQALIAARLDTLSPERKAMLADAAVVGKVFWAGAIAAMGNLPEADVSEAMRELSRKDLVRPARRSSMEGEAEYAFWHVLARDVAYAQLPRASKASRHIAAASWIESKAPERLEDLAEVLAYHYTSALELAKAAGQTEQVSELEAPALRFLTLAGERALGLDTAAALDAFERALLLTPEGHPERPGALARFGEAAQQAGRLTDAAAALEEAIVSLRVRGDILAAARAMGTLANAMERLNDPRRAELRLEALSLLEPLPPGPELVEALADVASDTTFAGRPEEGVALTERALGIAAELGFARPAQALGFRGLARFVLGDAGAVQDFREALELAMNAGQGRAAALLYNNLGVMLRNIEGPRAALETLEEGLRFAEARGLKEAMLMISTSSLPAALGAGELEEALASTDSLGPLAEGAGSESNLLEIRAVRAIALTLRGQAHESAGFLERLVVGARRSGLPDLIAFGMGGAAVARAALGEPEDAAALLAEIESTRGLDEATELPSYLPAMIRAAISIDEPELAERLVGHLTPRYPYAAHALMAANAALTEARGTIETAAEGYADAAVRWEGFGVLPEQGFALLGQGRCLLELSRRVDSAEVLQRAREIFTRCGMRPALEETDALLSKATALSS